MNSPLIAPQDLVRKAVVEVAQLPENELLIIIETVNTLKKQRIHPNRELASKVVAQAKARAAETSHLEHDELMKTFSETLDAIRENAISKGTAIEGELEGE